MRWPEVGESMGDYADYMRALLVARGQVVPADVHRGAVDLLREFIEPQTEPCWYDHHGYCQAHWLHEKPCPVERALDYLAGR